MTDLPDRGRVIVTQATYRIGDFGPGALKHRGAEGPAPCEGVEIMGTQIRYKAGAASGADSLSFRVTFQTGQSFDVTYRMTVE